nr:DUF6088 family protein [uncultured Albidiferax sp.]
MKLEQRMLQSVMQRKGNVILRAELTGLGSASQVTAALKSLQTRGVLVRIGTGIYAKTRKSAVTGNTVPAGSLESLSVEALRKLGVPVLPSRAVVDYNAGKTTQMSGTLVIHTGQKRIHRKISVGGRCLAYENDIERSLATA